MQAPQDTTEHGQPESQVHMIKIHVNEHPVHMAGHHHTGLEIKEAAVKQGVKIQTDFLLYLLRHHEPNKLIDNGDEVRITDESRFHAIADDDNS